MTSETEPLSHSRSSFRSSAATLEADRRSSFGDTHGDGVSDATFRRWLPLIVLLGLGARGFHYLLCANSDEQQYVMFARHLTEGDAAPVGADYCKRIVLAWAINLWGQAFAPTLESVAVMMFLLSGLGIVLTAQIAREMFGNAAGLFAALLVAFFPVDILHDVRTNPETLANPLLLTSIWLYLLSARKSSLGLLFAAAFLAGLMIGVKEYYPLIALCYAAGELLRPRDPKLSARLTTLAIGFGLGLLPSFLLQYAATGDFWRQWRAVGGTAEMYDERDARRGMIRTALSEVLNVARYVNWLIVENGPLGVVLIAGLPYLCALARRRRDCFVAALAVVGFVVFLSATPVRLSPLTFLEKQPRYMLVFLPLLAVGAGGLLAQALPLVRADKLLLRCGLFGMLVAAGVGVWLPNNYMTRGEPITLALRKAIDQVAAAGIDDLVVPWYFERTMPESYRHRGVRIHFAANNGEFNKSQLGGLRDFVAGDKPVAIFVPPSMENSPELAELRVAGHFERRDVLVPGSSLRDWLDRAGFEQKIVAASAVYVRSEGK